MTASTLITDWLGRGVHSARPATPNISSGGTAIYTETDTGHTFVWNGTAWVDISTGLYGQLLSIVPTASITSLSNWGQQNGATVNDGTTGICVTGSVVATDISIRYTTTVPATPYTITALIATDTTDVVAAFGAVFGWYDGTKIEVITLYNQAGGLNNQINVLDYATLTSAAAAANVRFSGTTALTKAWFSITDDGTNVTFKYLPEGNVSNARTLYTVAKASGYLSAYSHICFGVARRGAGSDATLMSWLQS